MGANARPRMVKKCVNFDEQLAGSIAAWASGAGISFGEAVRLLCKLGIASQTDSALTPKYDPAAIAAEIWRAEGEAVAAIAYAIDAAVEELMDMPEGGDAR